MIRCFIDNQEIDLSQESQIAISLSIASITEIETGRTGYTKTIQVPLTAHNCLVLGNAAEIHSPEMFNQQVHTARIEADGCTIIEGVPMISRCGQDADGSAWCQINIIGAGKEWVKLAAEQMFNEIEIPFETTISATTVYQSWSWDYPVRFFPVQRDRFTLPSTTIQQSVRMLTFRDYHPFLHVKSLLEQIAKQAGYTIQSQFFASDLFNSLYISGAYPEKDTGLLLERMGFLAKRFQPAEATADRFGRVYADPLTSLNSIGNIVDSADPNETQNGQTLSDVYNYNDAFRQIEKANSSKLQGIFGDGAWTNKNRLPDRLLKDLIEHFSTKTLSIANCPEDELGQGYEYLIKKFADDSGHTAQEFYTNRTVVHLMTEMLAPESGESIYDPTCGSAGMLISAIAYLKASKKEWRNVSVYGQEINALTSAIGKMNLFLHGVKDFSIVNGDTLKAPAFIEHGQLKTFDLILANPPYSISQWDREAFLNDKYGRNFWGVPPQGRADYAFFQHIVKSLDKKTGRCAILFPHGVLFRNEENDMREKLVKSDCLECVIGLGPNLFYNSPMEACIVICRMNKAHDRKGKVLFINAINEVERKNAQSYLTESHIKKIAQAYAKYESDDDIAKVATIQEIENNNFSLSIPLYVKEPLIDNTQADERDLQERYSAWSEASKRMRESYELLNKMLEEGGNADA